MVKRRGDEGKKSGRQIKERAVKEALMLLYKPLLPLITTLLPLRVFSLK